MAVVMLTAILLFMWYSLAPRAQMESTAGSIVEQANQAGKQRKGKNAGSKRVNSAKPSRPDVSESLPVPVFELRVPVPLFPREADLAPGITSTMIKQQFGDPDFCASWTEFGDLLEKYIYLSRRESTTFIIDNGIVKSVRTERSVVSIAP